LSGENTPLRGWGGGGWGRTKSERYKRLKPGISKRKRKSFEKIRWGCRMQGKAIREKEKNISAGGEEN